ncbi:helix-turn-helix domain-containing protein [Paenibacillus silvisoli]|uniref:helix-turn-helix domain-containing protein n=1 Tax=Paenibacillus silvisoli TaxID=3110539 RepID=UPI002804D9ED|nr:helix-turn-helix domain-containing protein [Paenibacillus silvisoli]
MGRIKRKLIFTLYRKMLISYICLVTLSISLISITLFSLFSSSTAKEVNNIAESMLTQTSYSGNVIYDQILSIGNHLIHNPQVVSAMVGKEKDLVGDYLLVREFTSLQAVYPFINFISVYNGYLDTFINTKGLRADDDMRRLIVQKDDHLFFEYMPRSVKLPYSSHEERLISFLFSPDFSRKMPAKSAVIINMDEHYLNNMIKEMGSGTDAAVFVMNSQGTVLSHTSPVNFLDDISQEPYVRQILSSKLNKGYLSIEVNGHRQLITYVKSAKLDWVYVSMKPLSELLSNINSLKNITVSISFSLLIAGVLFSLLLTHNFYNPIKQLMKQIKSNFMKKPFEKQMNEFKFIEEALLSSYQESNMMRESITSSANIVKETYLSQLIKGNHQEAIAPFKGFNGKQSEFGPYFQVLICKIDGYHRLKNNSSINEQAIYRIAVMNIANEFMQGLCNSDVFEIDKNEFIIFNQLEQPDAPEQLMATITEIQHTIQKWFKITVSVGIGIIVHGKENIHQSYQIAKECVLYQLIAGYNSVVGPDQLRLHAPEPAKYPIDLEKTIIEAIQLNNHKQMDNEITAFIQYLKGLSYPYVVIFTQQLVGALSKHYVDMNEWMGKDRVNIEKILLNFPEIDSLEEIKDIIIQYASGLNALLTERRSNKNNDMIEEIQGYIAIHYGDANLSIEFLAHKYQLTPGYLGKLFKLSTNIQFTDYLNTIRLEKAKELLETTSEPVASICEQVGAYSTSYFYTLFKKKNGMSPSEYRRKLQINKFIEEV